MAHAGSIIAAGLGRGRVRLPGRKKRVSVRHLQRGLNTETAIPTGLLILQQNPSNIHPKI